MGSGGFAWEGGAELVAAPVPLQSDYIVTSDQGVAATIWTSCGTKDTEDLFWYLFRCSCLWFKRIRNCAVNLPKAQMPLVLCKLKI